MDKQTNTGDKRTQELKESNAKEHVQEAHTTADEDIANDPEMQTDDPEADLDEGELAELDNNNDKTDI